MSRSASFTPRLPVGRWGSPFLQLRLVLPLRVPWSLLYAQLWHTCTAPRGEWWVADISAPY